MATNEIDPVVPGINETPGAVFVEAGMGQAWQSGAAARALTLGMAPELMLDLADLRAGIKVLDVAAGTGEQTLVAARRVGPRGRVLATDIAAGMLEVAAEQMQQAGLANVETRVMDAQSLDLVSESFDAVISRLGILLIPDRQRALAEIHRVLKPGGKLAVIVFGAPERNPLWSGTMAIGRRHAGLPLPPLEQPGIFALGAPNLLEHALRQAGFRAVEVRAVSAPRHFPSIPEAMGYLTGSTPMLREPLAKLDPAGRAAMLADIEQSLRQYEGPEGVEAPGEVLVGVGTK